jgi:hypothetical protein
VNRTLLLPIGILLAAGLLTSAFARPLAPPRAEGEISEQMEVISAGMKQIRRSLREEGKEEHCLGVLAEMQAAALRARLATPPMATTLPEGDRAAFVRDYRKTMVELLTKMLALEVALLDREEAAITAAFQAVRAMEDSGHERFTKDG